MKIHIETSGVNKISGNFDWITLSPKRHSPPNNYFLEHFNELKIIVNNKKDLDFAIDLKKSIVSIDKDLKSKEIFNMIEKKYYLQPAWKNDEGYSLAIDFVKTNPDWNLSLQTHKYLKIQ